MPYTLQLEQPEAQLIVNVLCQLPYAQSASLINRIKTQIQRQDADSAIDIGAGDRWEHHARNVLPPEEFARLQALVQGGGAQAAPAQADVTPADAPAGP